MRGRDFRVWIADFRLSGRCSRRFGEGAARLVLFRGRCLEFPVSGLRVPVSGEQFLEFFHGMAAGPVDEGLAGGVFRLVGSEDLGDMRGQLLGG